MSRRCWDAHLLEFGEEPLVVASAPGSLHLFGEHVEFARGHVLSLALPRRAWATVSARDDNLVKIHAADYKERKKFSLSNLKYKKEDRWANQIKGLLYSLDNMGCKLAGVNVTIHSELPEGRGLGASSALGVAALLALCAHFNFEMSDAQMVWMVHGVEANFCHRYSHISSCFVSYHAHAGALFALDLRAREYRHLRLSQGEYSFWVLDSMVNPVGARQELLEWKEVYDQLKARVKPLGAGRDMRDYSPADAYELLEDCNEAQRRLGHFVAEEFSRTHLAEDGVEASNIPPVGKLLNKSHEGLRDQLELSCPEIDWLVKHGTMVPGILGARMSGLGLGACMVLLTRGEVVFDELLGEYERIFGFKPLMFRAVPSHKAQLHSLGDFRGRGGLE